MAAGTLEFGGVFEGAFVGLGSAGETVGLAEFVAVGLPDGAVGAADDLFFEGIEGSGGEVVSAELSGACENA